MTDWLAWWWGNLTAHVSYVWSWVWVLCVVYPVTTITLVSIVLFPIGGLAWHRRRS